MPALVLASHGNHGIVELADGAHCECVFRRSVGRPLCGDRVEVDETGNQSMVVTAISPRRNEFVRGGSRGLKQAIAANLDRVLIVVAPVPEPSRDLLERYLVAVHSLGITPVIVLNKSELAVTGGLHAKGPLSHLDEYEALGYRVLRTSCKTMPGVQALTPVLQGRISILVGQSGVGKSSLANALLPDLALQTGALSRATGKGTHTTTSTVMYKLPCGGRLIDSPGVWEYGLWQMEQRELVAGFIEFEPFEGLCRFNDCHHAGEPGCAVQAAVDENRIRAWRLASYRRLLKESVD